MFVDSAATVSWSNWLDNEVFDTHVAKPATEADVAAVIHDARANGQRVRVVGTGHSSTPLLRTAGPAGPGVLLSLDNMRGVLGTDPDRGRARVYAGTKIRELGEPLWEGGVSLTNQGEIDRQAIAGAVATGTHGTGLGLGSVSSGLRSARLINGRGEVVQIDESTPDWLMAAQVSMGMLGVMTEIELAVSPAYSLTEWIGHVPFEVIAPKFLSLAETKRNFSILWLPSHQTGIDWELAPEDGSDATDVCFVKMYAADGDVDPGPIAEYGSERRRDRAYRIYPDAWEPLFYEMEYMFSVEAGLQCLPKLRNMIRAQFPNSNMPVELRFTAADEGLLSQNYGRASAVLSVTGDANRYDEIFFDACEALFLQYHGRPHWGKLHKTTPELVRKQFPGHERFCKIRREFDPDGTFLNEYLHPLFA